jgi:hypothetical protein
MRQKKETRLQMNGGNIFQVVKPAVFAPNLPREGRSGGRRKEAKRDGCALLGHTATLGAVPWARRQLSMAQGKGEQQEKNQETVLTSMVLGTPYRVV